jgi:pimeloyl-ACP methyl ester carboxylesterase
MAMSIARLQRIETERRDALVSRPFAVAIGTFDLFRVYVGERLGLYESRARHGPLARIIVPTALIWGRQTLQVRLEVIEAASARHGWPLHVIDGAGDDAPMNSPKRSSRHFAAPSRPPPKQQSLHDHAHQCSS